MRDESVAVSSLSLGAIREPPAARPCYYDKRCYARLALLSTGGIDDVPTGTQATADKGLMAAKTKGKKIVESQEVGLERLHTESQQPT